MTLQLLWFGNILHSTSAGFVHEEYVWMTSCSFFCKLQLLRCVHYFFASISRSSASGTGQKKIMEHNMLSPEDSKGGTQERPTNCQEANWWLFMMPPFHREFADFPKYGGWFLCRKSQNYPNIKMYLQIIGENDSKSHQNQAPGVQNHHIPRKMRFRQKQNLFLVHGHIGPQTIVMDEIN